MLSAALLSVLALYKVFQMSSNTSIYCGVTLHYHLSTQDVSIPQSAKYFFRK